MSEDISVAGRIVKETELAISFKGKETQPGQPPVWLPKSQIAVVQEFKGVSVTMPLWLAKNKGFY
jgi:hypothetical protein